MVIMIHEGQNGDNGGHDCVNEGYDKDHNDVVVTLMIDTMKSKVTYHGLFLVFLSG